VGQKTILIVKMKIQIPAPSPAAIAAHRARSKLKRAAALTRSAMYISMWKKSKQCFATKISQGENQLRYCLLEDTCETHFFESQYKQGLFTFTSDGMYTARINRCLTATQVCRNVIIYTWRYNLCSWY